MTVQISGAKTEKVFSKGFAGASWNGTRQKRLRTKAKERGSPDGQYGLLGSPHYELSLSTRGAGKRYGSAYAAPDGLPAALPELYPGHNASCQHDALPGLLRQCGPPFRYSGATPVDRNLGTGHRGRAAARGFARGRGLRLGQLGRARRGIRLLGDAPSQPVCGPYGTPRKTCR